LHDPVAVIFSLSDGWRLSMRSVVVGLILAAAMLPANADVAPEFRPDTPRPSIRGVEVEEHIIENLRPATMIHGCTPDQPACNGSDLSQCFVVGLNGHSVHGGDIVSLMALAKAAGTAAIKLKLEHCALTELEIGR
jgi:hypothetical protein